MLYHIKNYSIIHTALLIYSCPFYKKKMHTQKTVPFCHYILQSCLVVTDFYQLSMFKTKELYVVNWYVVLLMIHFLRHLINAYRCLHINTIYAVDWTHSKSRISTYKHKHTNEWKDTNSHSKRKCVVYTKEIFCCLFVSAYKKNCSGRRTRVDFSYLFILFSSLLYRLLFACSRCRLYLLFWKTEDE